MATVLFNQRICARWQMELKGVEAFVTVAELESMNAAARKLGYAQSTVTMQIKNLERDLKVTLLERSPTGVRLSSEGAAFLPHARAVLAAVAEAHLSVGAHTVSGALVLGSMESIVTARLLPMFEFMSHRNPDSRLAVSPRNTPYPVGVIRCMSKHVYTQESVTLATVTTTSSPRGEVVELGIPWRGVGPFLFASRHVDKYPRGNAQGGPEGGVGGRALGSDFNHPSGWSMYHGDTVPGFPAHPHRGFETVTIAREGVVDHADSTGAGARYGDGDVQWVTAGRGVSHSEMFPLVHQDAENPFELYQLWLNLPAASKGADPEFTMQWREDIPVVTGAVGARATVIAGAFDSVSPLAPPKSSWAAADGSDVAIWLIDLAPNSSIEIPDTNTDVTERLLYVHGDPRAAVHVAGTRVRDGQGFAQTSRGRLTLTTTDAPATVLVLQGVPIDEPVVAYGPFVMNTEAEIQEAFADYRRDQFGGWPWPSTAPVYQLDTPRFAKYGDGRLEHP